MSEKKPKHARHAAPHEAADAAWSPKRSEAAASPRQVDRRQASQASARSALTQAVPAVEASIPPVGGRYYASAAYEGASVPPMGSSGYAPATVATAQRRRKTRKVVAIVFGVLIALVAIAYVGVAVYFSGHFMPNTKLGNVDVSLMSAHDAERALASEVGGYKLTIDGQGFSTTISASDAGLDFDESSIVKNSLSQVDNWLWPMELVKGQHSAAEEVSGAYDTSGIDAKIRAAIESFNANAIQPTNATIAYDSASRSFTVKKETSGTAINADAVVKAADAALMSMTPKVKLTAEDLIKPSVLSSDQKLTEAAKKANTMIGADLVLTMAGAKAAEVNSDVISQWIVLGDDLSATLNQDALAAWVDDLVSKTDTVGSSRTYTRADGKVVTVAGGIYGWEVDHDALLNMVRDAVNAGTKNTSEVPTVSQGTAYNGAGARDWGNRYLDIDLAEQHARFYDDSGALVWESDVVSGEPDGEHDTSVGVFVINNKESPSTLNGYNGNTKIYSTVVQYWMPFDGNAIGLHDADWQAAFGGTRYKDGYGSHGCVNLPPDMAASLFSIIKSGDTVVSHW